jgi:hypothetical protein
VSRNLTKAKRVVCSIERWLAAVPEDGERDVLELHHAAPPARILRLAEALHDHEALRFFLGSVFCLTEAALALGMSEQAVLGLVERGELRGIRVGGERGWLFSCRRVIELMKRAQAADMQGAGLRMAEEWFKRNGSQGFMSDER